MRNFLFFTILGTFCSCNGNKNTMHVYLVNSDSVYYCEGEKFNIKKIRKSVLTDSLFMQQMLLTAAQNDYEVSFKPMTSLGNSGEPVGDMVEKFSNKLKAHGISYRMGETDSAERAYFDDVTILEFLKKR